MRDSEFACEVVRVTELLPHPNADRLEIAKFATADGPSAYTVCHIKGVLAVGDLATYVGVDCIVPLARDEFSFLRTRPDAAGKATFRVRAARLRGTYSEGFLIPSPEGGKVGDERAENLGITYHAPVEQSERGLAGPTAPSGKPKRDWRRELIPEFGVASLRKAPYHFEPGEQVTITEKIHGSNIRFGWVQRPSFFVWLLGLLGISIGWQWVVGSHRTFKTDNRSWWQRFTSRLRLGPGYYGEDLWIAAVEARGLRERARAYRGVMFFGEVFGLTPTGKKIQDLTYGMSGTALVIFDALDIRTGERLAAPDLAEASDVLDVSQPPHVFVGAYPGLETVRGMAEGQSWLCPEQIREGVVVRSLDGSKRGKWVGEGYRLRKEQA